MIKSITLGPAFDKDYNSALELFEAFEVGELFEVLEGKYKGFYTYIETHCRNWINEITNN